MSDDSESPLLLHSLSTFRTTIFDCLAIAGARRIVEIGSETGAFTLELAAWAAEHGAEVVSVDPEPAQEVLEHAAGHPQLEVIAGPSPAALEGLEPGDVYIIDGDHNYYTVAHELAHAYGNPDVRPLCILHDIGWPCARRDFYYAPERLPADALHPHSFKGGVTLTSDELVKGGFRGEGGFAWACEAGGPRNGVLTAVEDTLAEHEDLRLATIPCIFGVGFVWSHNAGYGARLAERLEAFDGSPLLTTLERNRLTLYLRVIELQDQGPGGLAADRLIADLQEQVGRLDAENARLRLEAIGEQPT